MRALLTRTGSMPVNERFVSGSTKASIPRHNSIGELFSSNADRSTSRISLNVRSSDRSPANHVGMRRALSESDVIRSGRMLRNCGGFKPSSVRIPEEEEGWGSLIWKDNGIPVEEIGFSGGGFGKGSGDNDGNGNGNRGGGNNDRMKIGEYYREMLKSNPNNSLLLMNYGRFLYEVEKDAERAEECYGRAILENPGDGEALSMYGKLIWETQRDEKRAKGYFDQAMNASPDDCMVLGSFAHFMWEADDDDHDDDNDEPLSVLSHAMLPAL